MSEKALTTKEAAPLAIESWSPTQVMAQVTAIQELMKAGMRKDEHFGVIPGTDKPSLYKPGAEKLCLMFRLAARYEVVEKDLGNGHREIRVMCSLYHINTEKFWGSGMGSCSTMETKYRYRGSEMTSTGVPVPKEYWDLKKAGKIKEASERLGGPTYGTLKTDTGWFIAEKGGKKDNPDIADTYNTVLKMAKKRALVDATLNATAASDIFTQDVEDFSKGAPKETAAPAPAAANGETMLESAVISPTDVIFQMSEKKAGRKYWLVRELEGVGKYYTESKEVADILITASKDHKNVWINFRKIADSLRIEEAELTETASQ